MLHSPALCVPLLLLGRLQAWTMRSVMSCCGGIPAQCRSVGLLRLGSYVCISAGRCAAVYVQRSDPVPGVFKAIPWQVFVVVAMHALLWLHPLLTSTSIQCAI
jgi:hypothetical protein